MMDDNEINVSVIVPIYNVEPYLRQCLDSVVKQQLHNIELILIDDGSTDSSGKIAKEYSEKYEYCKLFHQKNSGQSAARNLGVKNARGKYVYFLDSDDYLVDGALEYLFSEAEQSQAEVIIFDADKLGNSELLKEYSNERKHEYNELTEGKRMFFLMNQKKEYKSPVWMYFYERNFLTNNAITFYPGIIHEDELYTLEVLWKAKRVIYRKKKLYVRRIREGSTMTVRKLEKSIAGYFTVVTEFWNKYINSLSDSEYETEFFYYVHNLYLSILCSIPELEPSVRKKWIKTCSDYSKSSKRCLKIRQSKSEMILKYAPGLYLGWHRICRFIAIKKTGAVNKK